MNQKENVYYKFYITGKIIAQEFNAGWFYCFALRIKTGRRLLSRVQQLSLQRHQDERKLPKKNQKENVYFKFYITGKIIAQEFNAGRFYCFTLRIKTGRRLLSHVQQLLLHRHQEERKSRFADVKSCLT